jgi:predicted negative regulator of RcsB-dependent stress response
LAKKQKRMSKEELRKPDKIEESLKKGYAWLEKNSKLVITLMLLVVGGVTAKFVLDGQVDASNDEVAEKVRDAVNPLLMPVVEDTDRAIALKLAHKLPVYATREEQLKAAHKSISAVLKNESGSALAGLLTYSRASLDVALGKSKEGSKVMANYLATNGNSALSPLVALQTADAQLQSGDFDGARKSLGQAVKASSGTQKAMALLRLGDLSNPLVVKKGDAGVARTFYEQATKIIADRKEHPLSNELAMRLAVLP